MNNRVDTAAIAAALGASKRAAEMRAAKEAWPFEERTARGGRKRFYDIASLPHDVQAALAGKIVPAAPAPSSTSSSCGAGALLSFTRGSGRGEGEARQAEPGSSPGPRSVSADARAESLARIYEAKSEKQKAKARAALEAVQHYHELLAKGFRATLAAAAVSQARTIHQATLGRHLRKVHGEPRDLWLFLLLPGYAGRTARAAISPEALEILKANYLRRPSRTAKSCVKELVEANRAGRLGWVLPSERTMERLLAQIPRDVRVLARQGREELLKLYPPQQRVKAALAALDIVNGDGYQYKGLWVQFDDGEIRRAKTWFWQDVYSSKILAWRTDKTEHTELVRLSFGDLVERYGIPARAVLQDNTTAAANKTMSGGVPHRFRFKVKPEEPDGVFKLLGVPRVMWATPAHGQAKPVERTFGIGGMGEYVSKAADFAGAYDESEKYNGKTRPIPLAKLEEVIAREVAAMNARTGRRGAMHRGRSWDEVFAESYARATVRRATEEQRRLWLLCTEPVVVHRNATIVLDAGRMVGEHRANRYWCRELLEHVGRMVAARFDPQRLHEGVHVYTADGRYIAFAECHDPAGFNDGNAAREHSRDRKTFLRSTREALEAELRMNVRQAGATLGAARSGAAAASSIPAPKVIEGVFRDPLERPRYVPRERTESERAELAALEAASATPPTVNVLELRSDADKHAHWKALDERRGAGELLAEQEEAFWRHWPSQDYYRIAIEAETEFEQVLATRASA